MGRADEKPPVPLNLVGDYGGGGMLLAFGMLSAIMSAQRTGKGQVVDAAITDGTALLMTMFCGVGGPSDWQSPRGTHLLTGAAPFYDTYETADGGFIALGAIEPQFHAIFLERTGLADDPLFARQLDKSTWPAAKARLTAMFKTRSRDEWCAVLVGTDACFAPVLAMEEAPDHPQNRARGTYVEEFGIVQPAPAPRYSDAETRKPELHGKGADSIALLAEAGYAPDRIEHLISQGIISAAPPPVSIGTA
jgi:alpha-methylacyl-CoA racemase